MLFLRIIKHLLPRARAWNITILKYLRLFFDGLTGFLSDIVNYIDLIYLDLFPQTTRELDKWESQFGLPNTGLTEQERRDRLDAAWKELGGQSPSYIQGQLQANGFDVYVHDWWDPANEPAVNVKVCVTPRDPTALLVAPSYPLVNKIPSISKDYDNQLGDGQAQFGKASSYFGKFSGISIVDRVYFVPTDDNKWPYFLYIGAQVFPNLANVDAARRDEFEALLLKICPAQLWIGVMVNYI